jgi:glycerophosphoryl diester phosphodiesterase
VPLSLAHRGDWSEAPENTLAAFRAAERAGADMIELDVRRTADGGVAVVHDPTLERIWGVPRAVADSTLAEVQAVEVDGHRIPTLGEALACVSLPVMVDYTRADVVEPALAVIEGAGALERVLFSGENVPGHRRIRELAPSARIALTWTRREPPPDALLAELDPEYFNPPWQLLDARVVDAMRGRGRKISTWTVDDPAIMRQVVELGADAIVTNRIGELVSLLAGEPC